MRTPSTICSMSGQAEARPASPETLPSPGTPDFPPPDLDDGGPDIQEERLLAALDRLRRTRGKRRGDEREKRKQGKAMQGGQSRGAEVDRWQYDMAAKVDLILMVSVGFGHNP